MPVVGAGVYEMRIHTELEHRVLYIAKFSEGVYVLHAFEKKTQHTRQRDIDVARVRFNDLIASRRQSKSTPGT